MSNHLSKLQHSLWGKESETERTKFLSGAAFTRKIWLQVVLQLKVTRMGRVFGGTLHDRTASWRTTSWRNAFTNTYESSKPVARYFNLPNHSHHNMTICGLSLHHGNTESRKNLEQKFIFQLGTLSPHGINERLSFH